MTAADGINFLTGVMLGMTCVPGLYCVFKMLGLWPPRRW